MQSPSVWHVASGFGRRNGVADQILNPEADNAVTSCMAIANGCHHEADNTVAFCMAALPPVLIPRLMTSLPSAWPSPSMIGRHNGLPIFASQGRQCSHLLCGNVATGVNPKADNVIAFCMAVANGNWPT